MKTIELYSHELAKLDRDQRVLLVRPVECDPVGNNGGELIEIAPTTLPIGKGWDARYRMDNPKYLGPCPFGESGDNLAVLEEWGVGCRPDPYGGWVDGIELKADAAYIEDERDALPLYAVKLPESMRRKGIECLDDLDVGDGWKPAASMPVEFSQRTLAVVSVRAEKRRSISTADCLAAGACTMEEWHDVIESAAVLGLGAPDFPRGEFDNIWDLQHPDHPWESAWCWLVEAGATR